MAHFNGEENVYLLPVFVDQLSLLLLLLL